MQRRVTLIVALLALAAIAYAALNTGPAIPERAALVIELSGPIEERPPIDWLDRLSARGPALPTLILQLEKARRDERIAGVVLKVQSLETGFARLQELREAVAALAEKKPVVAWLDLGALNATRELYLASAAKQIFVAPGYLGPVAGVTGHFLYLRGFLDKVGIAVEAERIGEYKSAPEMFTERAMTEPARKQANEILDAVYGELVAGIAKGRNLAPNAVRKLVDTAPGTAAELVDAELVDGVAQPEELLEKAGFKDLEELSLNEYLGVDPGEFQLRNGPKIALVFAEGTIAPGGVGLDSGFTPERIGSALDAAAEDDDIKAVVLRINSGGGSSQASEAIWQRVVAAKKKKPVVVSMGDAAASGGYYVACAADSIVAQPTTLTGSIGIFFLRPSFETLLERLEIRSETIGRGSLSGIVLPDHRMSEGERARMRHILRDQYQLFLQRVAAGRPLKTEEVDDLGQGRIWMGGRAQEVKLVDALGGLSRAVDLAKEKAGIAAELDPQRVVFPAPQGLADQLRSLTGGLGWAWLRQRVAQELPDWLAASTLEGAVYLPSYWVHLQ